jgi:Asp-tRNA(Asn)/Glu-tRNA(Gln) amidotransferase A subunit family amidase
MNKRLSFAIAFVATLALLALTQDPSPVKGAEPSFSVMETTIQDVHDAFKSKTLTSRQLVQMYLDRIAAYDKQGPTINCVITINPKALEEADGLDAAYKQSGLTGPLHGIPVILKDQIDSAGMPTTLGSVVMKDYVATQDSFVVAKLKKAGAIVLAKVTLGEMGGGDTYGSLFGETHNPYDLERTVGGSSGGTGAGITANFATIGVGQEGNASIRRPSTWNSIVGMRPTAGLVSRSGVWGGWPSKRGSLGPMARSVTDLAKLLDVMVGYDPDDPITALGVGHVPETYTKFLDKNGLKGARIGILRESIGQNADPSSEDFRTVTAKFDLSIGELKTAGAEVVDPIVIPKLKELLAYRGTGKEGVNVDGIDATERFFSRNPNSPYKTRKDMLNSPDYGKVFARRRSESAAGPSAAPGPLSEEQAREELQIAILKVMADYKLDAIVHKSVEHTPSTIKEGISPPYLNHKGAINLNTTLIYASSIAVPAGFTAQGLPVGITFFGRPYDEPTLLKLAYAYEQATHHRKPPSTTPALSAKGGKK